MDRARQQERPTGGGYDPGRRPRWGVIALIVLLHVAVGIGLARALAPDLATLVERAGSIRTVFVTPDPPPPTPTPPPTPSPQPSPDPDEGAAAEAGARAVPREVAAPEPAIPRPSAAPAPRAASTGTANRSGASEAGAGPGAGGSGEGTGSGRSGSGRGGFAVTRPIKIAGDIRSASDYPPPPGGRQARFGQSVTITMTVGVDGRASACRVVSPSNDPVADRITCELAVERFRFEPARDGDGNPVAAIYGWRQEFFRRR